MASLCIHFGDVIVEAWALIYLVLDSSPSHLPSKQPPPRAGPPQQVLQLPPCCATSFPFDSLTTYNMARTAIKKPARSPSTSRSASPILTPPSPDPNNDDGGALLYDIVQAFQKHGLTDTPEPASNTDTKVKNKKTRRSKAKKAAAQKDNPTVDNPKAGKTKVKEVKATSTELIQKPTQPLTVKRTTIIDAFNDYFGEVSQLANWQRLCADLDIEPMPTSITQCKKVSSLSVLARILDIADLTARKGTQIRLGQHLRLPRRQSSRCSRQAIPERASISQVHHDEWQGLPQEERKEGWTS